MSPALKFEFTFDILDKICPKFSNWSNKGHKMGKFYDIPLHAMCKLGAIFTKCLSHFVANIYPWFLSMKEECSMNYSVRIYKCVGKAFNFSYSLALCDKNNRSYARPCPAFPWLLGKWKSLYTKLDKKSKVMRNKNFKHSFELCRSS